MYPSSHRAGMTDPGKGTDNNVKAMATAVSGPTGKQGLGLPWKHVRKHRASNGHVVECPDGPPPGVKCSIPDGDG